MKKTWALLIIGGILTSAHFLRAGSLPLAATTLFFLAVPMMIKKPWVPPVIAVLCLSASGIWLSTAFEIMRYRTAVGLPWFRATFIIFSIALLPAAVPFSASKKKIEKTFGPLREGIFPAAAFLITFLLLTVANIKSPLPVLLLERFVPFWGWLEIAAVALYAAWLCHIFITTPKTSKLRSRIWLLFSIIFFIQLALGLIGLTSFLMTGKLHIPVPAVVLAGPIYRGGGMFMPLLFIISVILAGPAWCSYLCYFGSLDDIACKKNINRPPQTHTNKILRFVIFTAVISTALLMRLLGVKTSIAALSGVSFGVLGIGTMFLISRKNGTMFHCTVWCPLGLAADILGKLSPFRIKITDSCTECMACIPSCKYGALNKRHIQNKRPGLTCSLCGDCLETCSHKAIEYHFAFLHGTAAKNIFYVVVVSLHAVFLAVARV